MWSRLGADGVGHTLTDFSNAVGATHCLGLNDLLRTLQRLEPTRPAGPDEIRSADLGDALKATADGLGDHLKASSAEALNDLSTELRRLADMSANNLISALNSLFGGVREESSRFEHEWCEADYIRALQQSLHNHEKFTEVFERLKNDRSLKRPQIVSIASSVAFKMAKSTTRKIALKRIMDQHKASETTAAKIRANAGRSAA